MPRTTLTLGIATLLTLTAAATPADDKPKVNDAGAPAGLIGGYTIVAGEKYGEKIPADQIKGTTVRIAEDGIVVLDKEKKEVYAQTYTIDSDSKPWKITMKSKITPFTKDKEEPVAKGLIEKDGDTVRLIYAIPGGETPTEFKTKDKQLMFEMKNIKK
jgi:uncharacterized protein (TIGR03067 family)